MSKKLLMNNYSENGLMPVMDGLVCWLDGRDGQNGNTVWKDRSNNGNDFELNGFTFSAEDGWTGKNLKVNFYQYATKNISLAEEYTIEVDVFVDQCKNGEQTVFFYFGDGNNSGIWRECVFRKEWEHGSRFQIATSGYYNHMVSGQYKRYHIHIIGKPNEVCVYTDNVKLYHHTRINNIMSGLTANFYLGCNRKLVNFCKARFNSVKIYNRALTKEEVQQNYLYEQSIERN